MRVGFLVNQIDNRGTGNAVFDYAQYNEKILGNESYIFTFSGGNHEKLAVERYVKRFQKVFYADFGIRSGLDVLYHIKSGQDDGFRPEGVKYVVHAVFNGSHIHGDTYAAISEWLGLTNKIPWVSHIVTSAGTRTNLRSDLRIPAKFTVFGRHGGWDTFDIPFVWSAISKALEYRNDIYFVFLNTQPIFQHSRIIYLDQVAGPEDKQKFLNTCDIMLHARARGETFGISVGEFAKLGKPVITYGNSPEKAHYDMLGDKGFMYFNEQDLTNLLSHFPPQLLDVAKNGYSKYDDCTPENIMKKFKEVFLD